MHERRLWECINTLGELSKYYVIILDFDWFNENLENIKNWLNINCPTVDSKINSNTRLITFENVAQYTQWQLAWEN